MPIEIKVGQLLAGYTLETVKEGEEATLVEREFVSSEDEELFKNRINGLPEILLSYLPNDIKDKLLPVESMVAILNKDTTATLYLNTIPNDLDPVLKVRSKRRFNPGDSVQFDDIADIDKLEYIGISFPPESGVVVLFHAGNERAFFYDLVPLHDKNKPRDFDLEELLGSYFCYLSQRHLFELDDDDWQFMSDNKWFPFVTLKVDTRKQLIDHVKKRLPLDDLLPAIAEDVKANCENLRERIKSHSIFSEHSDILEHALDEYLQDDYISSTSILYPRIEGVMRSLYQRSGTSGRIRQSDLARATIQARGAVQNSGILLFPNKFHRYLTDIYFANFDPSSSAVLSRNSVGHGIAQQTDFNQKGATIGLLIIDQISFLLPDESSSTSTGHVRFG